MSNPEGVLVTFKYQGAAVLLMCLGKTASKRETRVMKGELDEKFDIFRGPKQVETNVVKDNLVVMADIPETGPGYEHFRILAGSVKLTKPESDLLRGSYDEIMAKDGFPAKWARGVNEVDDKLTACSATHKDPPAGGGDEDPPKE